MTEPQPADDAIDEAPLTTEQMAQVAAAVTDVQDAPGPPALFQPDTASSHAQRLTEAYPTLTPRAVDPTDGNSNHALRIEDQADGWYAEIAIDDEAHHAWLTAQIEAHLAAKKA